jgi:hypothetical protein
VSVPVRALKSKLIYVSVVALPLVGAELGLRATVSIYAPPVIAAVSEATPVPKALVAATVTTTAAP